jgi:ubiquinone/menaquinone biosynthesis C-methylase UbiE
MRIPQFQSKWSSDPVPELKSNVEWKQWGKEDPLFAVSSWKDKQKDGAAPWTEEEFYALGRSDWLDFFGHWQQYGVNTSSCLEVGCGAGRITRQLSYAFQHVWAVDVSEDMIHRAQGAVGSNVDFAVIDGIHLPQADSSVAAIFSAHVLQHLDDEATGHAYFREFYRVLEPGGTLMIHLPLYVFPGGPLIRKAMNSTHRLGRFLSNTRATLKRKLHSKVMRGTQYSVGDLYAFLSSLGFKDIEYRIFAVTSNGDSHPFVFVTK